MIILKYDGVLGFERSENCYAPLYRNTGDTSNSTVGMGAANVGPQAE